jgi:hypothetical protein
VPVSVGFLVRIGPMPSRSINRKKTVNMSTHNLRPTSVAKPFSKFTILAYRATQAEVNAMKSLGAIDVITDATNKASWARCDTFVCQETLIKPEKIAVSNWSSRSV